MFEDVPNSRAIRVDYVSLIAVNAEHVLAHIKLRIEAITRTRLSQPHFAEKCQASCVHSVLFPTPPFILIIETFAAMSTSIYRALLSDVMVAQCNYIE